MVQLKYKMPGCSKEQIIGIVIKIANLSYTLSQYFFYFLHSLKYSLKSFLSFIYYMSSALKVRNICLEELVQTP